MYSNQGPDFRSSRVHSKSGTRTHRGVAARPRLFIALAAAAVAALSAVACLNRPLCDVDCRPKTTNQFVAKVTGNGVDKIDLLFMIDNSASMDDKQKILQLAVPDLVRRLVNPNCVDASGAAKVDMSTIAPDADCPSPYVREFTPIRDIHVGIISSSLGDHGEGAICTPKDEKVPEQQQLNDHGWLIGTRSRFSVPAGGQDIDPNGFLDWNPVTHPNPSLTAFNTTFEQMVASTGSVGCGYEAQLESIYRFLVDPHPYLTIVQNNCPTPGATCAYPQGVDQNLLAQRKAFLRPDSLVAIILLTDENDCSIQDSGQGFVLTHAVAMLPNSATVCKTNPNDPCCYSCGGKPPNNCAKDPICDTQHDQTDDPAGLRCFHQVQRYGFDLLYPTARYVNALSQSTICTSRPDLAPDAQNCPDLDNDKKPDLVDNPLFATGTAVPRSPSLVFVAGILGVPWQDIASDEQPDGKPYGDASELHYQTADQLSANDTWQKILGNPVPGMNLGPVPPTDNLMQESREPRGGLDGETPPVQLAGTASGLLANPVNGHEWLNPRNGDLQYACIFKLTTPRPCTDPHDTGCDCTSDDLKSDNPLCQDPQGSYSQPTQYYAKAYPGLRELQVLKDFGKNSIVASICARNVDTMAQDYGYRPAVDAIVDRLKGALTGSCLPRQLIRGANGKLPCSVVEARPIPSTGKPLCSATPGRLDADPAVIAPAIDQLRRSGACDVTNKPACNDFYVCQIQEAGSDCHTGDKA
ncbi:MAG TPA: hypothetical protein VHU80_22765, partial [Polyangiaceae bacterium]|nr:hypothetical protein [Polyangiaceae bacterium]